MSSTFHSVKLEEYFKQFELEKLIDFLHRIFKFHYVKTRGDDGLYFWFGDRDWDMKSYCPMMHLGKYSIIFIDYSEDQIIQMYDRYYRLRAFI